MSSGSPAAAAEGWGLWHQRFAWGLGSGLRVQGFKGTKGFKV